MRFPVGAFVHLNSGSPVLQVLTEENELGGIKVGWWNYDKLKFETMFASAVCFHLSSELLPVTVD